MSRMFQIVTLGALVLLLPTSAVAATQKRVSDAVAPTRIGAGTTGNGTDARSGWESVVDGLRPGYESASPLPVSGKAMYYNPGVMERVIEYRKRSNAITDCPECVGQVALLRAGDIDRRVWLQRPGHPAEGPFHVVDVANKIHIPMLLQRGWAVDVDWETAVRWGMRGPVQVTVLASPTAVEGAPSYSSQLADPGTIEPVATTETAPAQPAAATVAVAAPAAAPPAPVTRTRARRAPDVNVATQPQNATVSVATTNGVAAVRDEDENSIVEADVEIEIEAGPLMDRLRPPSPLGEATLQPPLSTEPYHGTAVNETELSEWANTSLRFGWSVMRDG